jgi:hypothetical protein
MGMWLQYDRQSSNAALDPPIVSNRNSAWGHLLWSSKCPSFSDARCDMSTLEKKLDALIAREDHVQPEDVTLEYIRNQRKKNVNLKYDFSTQYGGYNHKGEKVLSPAESSALVATGYRFLALFKRPKK